MVKVHKQGNELSKWQSHSLFSTHVTNLQKWHTVGFSHLVLWVLEGPSHSPCVTDKAYSWFWYEEYPATITVDLQRTVEMSGLGPDAEVGKQTVAL